MQKGKKLVVALLIAIGITGAASLAPEATMAKSQTTVSHHASKHDDHGRHGRGHDDNGRDDQGKHGHGHDDGPGHH